MAFLLDTNVAIHLRDGDPMVTQKVAALEGAVLISVVNCVELDGGVYREPAQAAIRRARLDAMLSAIPALAFDNLAACSANVTEPEAGVGKKKPRGRGSRRGSGVGGNKAEAPVRGLRLPIDASWGGLGGLTQAANRARDEMFQNDTKT